MGSWIPRKLIISLVIITMVNLALMYGYAAPVRDPKFSSMYPLLTWRDPVSNHPFPLPIDRSAPIDEQIEAAQQVDQLLLMGDDINAIPAEIGYLTNLKVLAILFTPLTKLPPEIGQLRNLQMLDLNQSSISELPPQIGELSNLEGLLLTGTSLTQLPVEISNLPKLAMLDAYDTQVRYVPLEIVQLCATITCRGIERRHALQLFGG
ncbi:MAG: leucine-rich repeat domain-containing protein [Chloroflexi bacterium]|nr:leucine-rich repeat domain-containing protein [Chloroflexota bacterium]